MIRRLLHHFLAGMIHVYRHTLGYFLGGQCRFHPTCSAYGLDALREWGPYRGSWLTIKRIARCHPFSSGGMDLVPLKPRGANP